AARAATVEHELAGGLGFDEDGVERVADRGERVGTGDHRRVDADRHALGGPGGDAQELDRAAHLAGAVDVGGGDFGDAFPVHVGGGDAGVEGEAGQDRRLGRRVEAVDVGGGVGFGVPEGGRLVEGFGEAGAGGVHAGQDVVRGPVDDAGDAGDPVAV